jgi:hypothetical protein
MRCKAFLGTVLLPLSLLAQTAPSEFPADAQPIDTASLRQRLAGKVFAVKLADGSIWRVEYQESGRAYFNFGSDRDSGKWWTEDSKLCSEWQKTSLSCSEARIVGDVIYLKRARTGEVVSLMPK